MKQELYKDLTLDEKIGILHYIRGQQGLVEHAHYDSLTVNPSPTPRPSDLYVSSVLGIDFENFYTEEVREKNMKLLEEVKAKSLPYWSGGHRSILIVDSILDVLYVMLDIDQSFTINEELIMLIDNKIKELYDHFMQLHVPDGYELVEGFEIKGKPVYQKKD